MFYFAAMEVAETKIILKAGKSSDDVRSYRPICLLPITSKVMEWLFRKQITPVIESKRLISDHYFGFRKKHGTVEQVHRVVDIVNTVFDEEKYCTSVFLDITQAFD